MHDLIKITRSLLYFGFNFRVGAATYDTFRSFTEEKGKDEFRLAFLIKIVYHVLHSVLSIFSCNIYINYVPSSLRFNHH